MMRCGEVGLAVLYCWCRRLKPGQADVGEHVGGGVVEHMRLVTDSYNSTEFLKIAPPPVHTVVRVHLHHKKREKAEEHSNMQKKQQH